MDIKDLAVGWCFYINPEETDMHHPFYNCGDGEIFIGDKRMPIERLSGFYVIAIPEPDIYSAIEV